MISAIIDELGKTLLPERIKMNERMSRHTSFRIGGAAAVFASPETEEELIEAVKTAERIRESYLIVGNGSNLLVSDNGTGLVISTAKLRRIQYDGDYLTASCGCTLSELAAFCIKNELAGFEFASGIPGTVGGAVFMNAGAYGGEFSQIIANARVLEGGEIKTIDNAGLEFGYRSSLLQRAPMILLSVRLSLKHGKRSDILSKMKELNKLRAEKQPLEYPSAGSVFKRPEGNFAGKLIMEAGLAGYTIGGAQIAVKHCGFIINTGGATANDVYSLISHVKKVVLENCGIELEPEIRFIGDF